VEGRLEGDKEKAQAELDRRGWIPKS
jgi:hypothetical protein